MKLGLHTVLGMVVVAGASLLFGCSGGDGNSGAGASGPDNGTGGSNNSGGSNSGGSNSGGSNSGGSNSGGSNNGGSNNGGSSSGGSSGGGGCYGDFSLGQNAITSGTSQTLGEACNNSNAPTNCPDGTFIKFADTGECVCIVMCSSLQGVSLGDPCSKDGSWMCEKILATNPGANTATVCVPTKWGLCTADGGQGGSGGGQAGSGGSEQGGSGGSEQCKSSGDDCFDDSECCSGTCDGFNCA